MAARSVSVKLNQLGDVAVIYLFMVFPANVERVDYLDYVTEVHGFAIEIARRFRCEHRLIDAEEIWSAHGADAADCSPP